MDKIYCVKDTNNCFEGNINIYSDSDTKAQWYYHSQEVPMSGNLRRDGAEKKLEKLKEINSLSGFNLEWEIVEFTENEWSDIRIAQVESYNALGRNPLLYWHWNSKVEYRDISRGFVGKSRIAFKDICRRYSDNYIAKSELV